MRTPIRTAALRVLLPSVFVLVGAASLVSPARAQSSPPTFRTATWGMAPSAVRAAEPGTALGTRSDAAPDLDRVEAYFDVVRGKAAEITYGFAAHRLVYGAYRFTLKERDRPFSQTMGTHLRSTYGDSEGVEVSGEGQVLHLHWSTPRTKVIARFAPTSLHIQYWDREHWHATANRPAMADGPPR